MMFSPGIYVFVYGSQCPDDIAMKDWWHINKISMYIDWGWGGGVIICHIFTALSMVAMSKSMSIFQLSITGSVFILQRGNKYFHNPWVTEHLTDMLKFRFRLERSSEVENWTCFMKFSKSVLVSLSLQIKKLADTLCKTTPFWCRHQVRHNATYCTLYSSLREGGTWSKFRCQYHRKICGNCNHISRLHMIKADRKK